MRLKGIEKKSTFWSRLSETYRLVVLEDDTLREVNSYRVTLRRIYIWISMIAVLLILLVICLIIFTPARKLVPGYGDISGHKEFIELNEKVKTLEEDLELQYEYVEGIKRMLNSNDSSESVPMFVDSQSIPSVQVETRHRGPLGHLFFSKPLDGVISSGFDPETNHLGADVVASKGSPISAILEGVVVDAGFSFESGYTISIQHSNNLITKYKHNSSLLKKSGQRVRSGEAIAIIGNTGENSSGTHLHFEMWHEGHPIDPSLYFSFK